MITPKLYMILLGCRPPGRNTEQHDIFFGIAGNLKDLLPEITSFWKVPGDKIHIDAWREVNFVDDYQITIIPRNLNEKQEEKLFFMNLGGYKPGEFDEFHYKMLIVSTEKTEAIRLAKENSFYKHTGFKGAVSHIDDKFGVDIDDVYELKDILSEQAKNKYSIRISKTETALEDQFHLGYQPIHKI